MEAHTDASDFLGRIPNCYNEIRNVPIYARVTGRPFLMDS